HDLSIVKRIADRVAVMQNGQVIEVNDSKTLFLSPSHPYTKKLIESDPRGLPVYVSPDNPTLVQLQHLKVWFPITGGLFKRTVSHIKAVTNMQFKLKRGHSLGIVGESGSGKSTTGMA
ncbi:ATP-binding cassette domain-containing protein, partial [Vibrio anguillarum]